MTQRNEKPKMSPAKKSAIVRMTLRGVMVFLTIILMVLITAVTLLYSIFHGPSIAARNTLVRSLAYSSGTWWIPPLFLGEELAAEIIQNKEELELPNDKSEIIIDTNGALNGDDEEWKDHPDGIYIETVNGPTYTAHVMIVRDPSTVYMGTSLMVNGANQFSSGIPGERLNHAMEATGAIAGINAGAFFDNGSSSPAVGATPQGLVVSEGNIVWNDGQSYNGFVGFDENNTLIVAKSANAEKVKQWKIRDGCCFGPVLIMDGEVNQAAIDNDAGWNPRTAIGQRADGAIILVCIDGRQASGIGGSYRDLINIMVEYKAINACNLDGGSSSIMYYRDNYGLYGDPGKLQMVNSYSALQEEPRRMPTFFLVRPSSEE